MKINILGTEYEVIVDAEYENNAELGKDAGCCNGYTKRIVVGDPRKHPDADPKESEVSYRLGSETTLRHEIVHAHLVESGLWCSCSWATNETMVDWIALQFPKLVKTMIEAGCLEVPRGDAQQEAGQ